MNINAKDLFIKIKLNFEIKITPLKATYIDELFLVCRSI